MHIGRTASSDRTAFRGDPPPRRRLGTASGIVVLSVRHDARLRRGAPDRRRAGRAVAAPGAHLACSPARRHLEPAAMGQDLAVVDRTLRSAGSQPVPAGAVPAAALAAGCADTALLPYPLHLPRAR